MAIPIRVGALSSKNSGSTAGSLTISSIADGSWMILVAHAGDITTTLTTPAGWTVLKAAYTTGSRRHTIYGRIKQAGDTTVSVVKSGSLALSLGLEYGTGSDPVADWQLGTQANRAGGAPHTSTTGVALSITTTEVDVLVLAIVCEATSAEDTVAPVLSGTGWVAGSYVTDTASPDTTNIEQINFATLEQNIAGATGNATFTYQNSQASNAGGVQIGITPAVVGNVSPTAAFTHGETNLHVAVDGTTSSDSDGSITAYDWNWGDATTHGTGSTATHDYAASGTYTITLTVTDNLSATGNVNHDVTVSESSLAPVLTGSLSQKSTGSTAGSITVSSIPDDYWMLLAAEVGNTATTLTTPSGWTLLSGPRNHGSRRFYVYGRIKSGDTTVSVVKSASVALSLGLVYGVGADVVADWQVGSPGVRAAGDATGGAVQAGSGTTSVAPSITTVEGYMLAVAIMFEATTAEDTSSPVVSGSGWTASLYVADTAAPDTSNIEQINFAYKTVTAIGASGAATTTYQNSQANNGAGIQIGLTPNPSANFPPLAAFTTDVDHLTVDVDGTTSSDSDGTIASYTWNWGDGSSDDTGSTQTHTYATAATFTITLTVVDDGGANDTQTHDVTTTESAKLQFGAFGALALRPGVKKATAMYFNGVLLKRWGYTVDDMLIEPEIQVAWRGLGDVKPEMSMTGYDYAVAQGFKVLEVSVNRSLDGVFIMNHDTTLTRTTAATSTIASTNSTALLGVAIDTPTTGGVIGRLENLLDAYAETHVIFIDDKDNAYASQILAILDDYPDPQQHFVWKGFRGWTPAADVWTAAGYQAWGIIYDTDSGVMGTVGAPHASIAHFTMLGLNFDAAQTPHWDNARAIADDQNKRLLAHVIHSGANATTARGKDADGLMTGVVL